MADNITYTDKVTSQVLPNPAEEKIQAADLNEIKTVVNTNAAETDTNAASITTNAADILLRELISNKDSANGYAGLDASTLIPLGLLPDSVKSGSEYKGSWNATTNTPTLADGTGTNGDYYLVEVAGSQDLGSGTIDFEVGDTVIYNGTTLDWDKIGRADLVQSVNGFQGVIVLTESDIPSIASTYLALAGGTLTGALLGDQAISGYRPIESLLTASDSVENIVQNSWTPVDSSSGAITITISDATNAATTAGWEWEFFVEDATNAINFSFTGSQTVISKGDALGLTEYGVACVLKKYKNNLWRLVGAS